MDNLSHVNVSNRDRVIDYISKNPETTEYMVSKYMSENHYCARDTTRNLIFNNLIPSGKIIDKKVGNSFHKFVVNGINTYIILTRRIEESYEATLKLNELLEQVSLRDDIPNSARYYVRNLVHINQLSLFTKITNHAHTIAREIKSPEERDTLYLQLLQFLLLANKLNVRMLSPMNRDLEEIKHSMIWDLEVPEKFMMYVNEIKTLMGKTYSDTDLDSEDVPL